MLKGVLFDVHDTLVRKDRQGMEQSIRGLVEFLQGQGYGVDISDFVPAWKQAVVRHSPAVAGTDEVSFYGWWGELLEGVGIPNASTDLMDRANAAWWEPFRHATTPLPHAAETLPALKAMNLLLAVVSNSLSRNTASDLRATALLDYFDALYISSDVGKRKPDPLIYNAALDGLGLRPEHVIMVGDNPREDVFGAQRVGIRAVMVQSDSAAPSRSWGELLGTSDQPPAIPDWTITDLAELLDIVAAL